jgi:hypothetical protein
VKYVRAFGRFWWDFIVGDDWHIAAGVALALGLTKLLTTEGANVWWRSCSPCRSGAPRPVPTS